MPLQLSNHLAPRRVDQGHEAVHVAAGEAAVVRAEGHSQRKLVTSTVGVGLQGQGHPCLGIQRLRVIELDYVYAAARNCKKIASRGEANAPGLRRGQGDRHPGRIRPCKVGCLPLSTGNRWARGSGGMGAHLMCCIG